MKILISFFLATFVSQIHAQNVLLSFNTDKHSFEGSRVIALYDTLLKTAYKKDPSLYYEYWSNEFKKQSGKDKQIILAKYTPLKDAIHKKMLESDKQSDMESYEQELSRLEKEEYEQLFFARMKGIKAKEYAFKSRAIGQFSLFPVKNVVDAQLFYDLEVKSNKAKFLKNSLVNFSTEGGKASIFNEIYSDFFGPIRFSFGALISNNDKKDEEVTSTDSISLQQDATQRLLGGGGNGIINLGYPLLSYEPNESFYIKMYFLQKFSFDVPKLGTLSDKLAFNTDSGIEGSIFYTGALKYITIFTNFRIGYIAGNAPFYLNLLKEDEKSFFLNQFTIGLAINSTFRIGWSFYGGDKFVRDNFKPAISFSIIPN